MAGVIFGGHRKPYCAVITLALQSTFKTSTDISSRWLWRTPGTNMK